VITHFDGSVWRAMDSGTNTYLWDVWGPSPQEVYAVGGNTILRYDGNVWRDPGFDSGINWGGVYVGVWGTSYDNWYIVSEEGRGIYHYNGSEWEHIQSDGYFCAMFGSGPTDVYAVGWGGNILRIDGIEWREMETGTSNRFLDGWAFAPNDVYVAGYQSNFFRGLHGEVMHYDGSDLKVVATRLPDLHSTWAINDHDLFIAGNDCCVISYTE
jgi:hypothetical protein